MVVELDDTDKTVPRHLSVGGTPRKIIHSPLLNLLVVGFTKYVPAPKALEGDARDTSNSAVPVSSLAFIDPDR